MQTNLQTTVIDTLNLAGATRQAVAASTKLFGRLDKDTRDALILLLSLVGLAYCAIQYFSARR
jgi:hypothetical protein